MSLFNETYQKNKDKEEILSEIMHESINAGYLCEQNRDKKIVFLIKNSNIDSDFRNSYSKSPLFSPYYINYYLIDKDTETLSTNYVINSYEESFHKIQINKNNIVDKIDEIINFHMTDNFQLEIELEMLENAENILKTAYKDIDGSNCFKIKDLSSIISAEQEEKLKHRKIDLKVLTINRNEDVLNKKFKAFFMGFFFGIVYDNGLFVKERNGLNLAIIKNTKFNIKNTKDFGLSIFEYKNTFLLNLTKKYIETATDNYKDEILKMLALIIDWNFIDKKIFHNFFDQLTEREKLKEIKKVFKNIPFIEAYKNEDKEIENYLLTIKEYNTDFFYKRIEDLLKTRLTIENKNTFINLIENILSPEEIENNKLRLEKFFPILYEEKLNFNDFVNFKEKQIKSFVYDYRKIMNLFPVDSCDHFVIACFTKLLVRVLAQDNVTCFIKKEFNVIKQKKKDVEVIDKLFIDITGEDLSKYSSEYIQKTLRAIHDKIQSLDFKKIYINTNTNTIYFDDLCSEDLKNESREIYVNINLINKEKTMASKKKL